MAPGVAGVLALTAFTVHFVPFPFQLYPIIGIPLCLAAVLALWAPGIAIAQGLGVPRRLMPGAALIASSLIGWIVFLLWFALPPAGYLAGAAILLATGWIVLARPGFLTGMGCGRPLAVTFFVTVTYFCIGGDHGDYINGAIGLALRYWNTPDNVLPKMFADALMHGHEALLATRIADWHLGDRPPLETGMLLPLYQIAKSTNREVAFVVIGTAINAGAWVFGLWSFLRTVGVAERKIHFSMVLIALIGAVFVNTIYAWPKMLGGGLFLAALAILIAMGSPARPLVRHYSSAALGFGLSMLAHGTSAFAAPAAIPSFARRWSWAGVAIGAAVAAVVYAPWAAYQRFFDPPGYRLIKWHLAGVLAIDPRPPLQTIIDAYSSAGLWTILHNKIANIAGLVGTEVMVPAPVAGWLNGNVLGIVRAHQSDAFLPALGVLLVGVLAAPQLRRYRMGLPIVIMTVSMIVLEFGAPAFATANLVVMPFGLLLLAAAYCALGVLALPPLLRRAVIGLHALWFVVVWVASVGYASARGEDVTYSFDPFFLVCEIVLAAIVLWTVILDSPDLRRRINPKLLASLSFASSRR